MRRPGTRPGTRTVLLGVLVVSLLLAGVVSFYAASAPDGLTKVSQDQGFADTETDHAAGDGPFAGYGSSFISDERLSGGVAGVVGVLVVLALAGGLTLLVRRRGEPADQPVDQPADEPVDQDR
ncbi:PDGLE domain-containing protein [Nocardioides kribbensis]|uniref:PDGLE domain-containing protein n=1 Tax=Nocardioides kribbensis TaxID=305517 RepID=UPI0032DB31EE